MIGGVGRWRSSPFEKRIFDSPIPMAATALESAVDDTYRGFLKVYCFFFLLCFVSQMKIWSMIWTTICSTTIRSISTRPSAFEPISPKLGSGAWSHWSEFFFFFCLFINSRMNHITAVTELQSCYRIDPRAHSSIPIVDMDSQGPSLNLA